MKHKIYQVATNLNLDITEVEYIKKTESFYWKDEKSRDALDTNWRKSFDTKEDAVNYLGHLLKSKITSTQNTLDYYKIQESKFEEMYKK